MLPPLIVLPVLIGWLRIRGEKSHIFSSDEGVAFVAITYTFCFLALVWINARSVNLFDSKRKEGEENLRRSLRRVELLSEISEELLRSINPHKLINELCSKVMTLLDCQVFFNFLIENGGQLKLNAYSGIPEEEAEKIEKISFENDLSCCVARDGIRIIAENIPFTPDPRTDLINSLGIKAYACHPLLSGDKVIGTLSFGTKNRSTFKAEEIAFMKVVTDYVAIAIVRVMNENELRISEQRFRTITELLPVQIAITRPSDDTILFTNETYNNSFGYKKEELQGKVVKDLYYYPQDRVSYVKELNEKGKVVKNEVRVKRSDGSDFWIMSSTEKITFGNEPVFLSASVDITESKKTRDELLKLNRTLNSLGKSSQSMMHAVDEEHYLNEICKIIIEDCGHKMVWIGLAQNDNAKSVIPVAWYGFDDGYINQMKVTWADNERGRGPTGTAIRTGKTAVCHNMLTDPAFEPWRKEAIKRGYASSIVFPLKADGKPFGALSIYSKDPDPFSKAEIDLLADLSNDLSYGISYIRLRETERQANSIIKESEEKYKLLFEGMTEGFAFHEIIVNEAGEPCDYRFLSINPAFEKQTGLKASEILGKRVKEVLPQIEEFWIETYGKVALTGERIEFENYFLELDSYFRVSAFCPKKGFFAVIFENINESKKAEREIKESREKLDLALDNAKIGLWEWNIKTDNLFLDERMEKIIGSRHHLQAKKFGFFEKIIFGEDLPHFRKAIHDAVNEDISFDTVFRIKNKDGELNHISSRANLQRDTNGDPIKMTGVCFDITDMHRGAEQALFALNQDLIRSNRELEQFAYVASHDLQEPLRMVSSFTQLLSMRYKDKLDKVANEYIQYAVDGALRMQGLINDLLEYSRIETRGKKPTLIEMQNVLDQAVNNLSIIINEKNAVITNDKLPLINADGGQMVLLLQNLINNGIKFCSDSPRIHISSTEDDKYFLFSVKDNGIGIESQYFEKIFQIFQRLHGTNDYGGTGIGLSICKRIVERHNGRIWVESKPGQGSVFYFTIMKNK